MKEIRKPIIDYEKEYHISNLGRIKSLKWGKERILKNRKNKDGYYKTQLHRKGTRKDYLVHRLVGMAFIPNLENKKTINHKDGNKKNNYVNNLEWATNLENNMHAIIVLGKHNGGTLIHQFEKKGNFIKTWNYIKDITKGLGINQGNISSCCRGKLKTAGGFKREYA